MQIRDRIKELRRVKASELLPNPKNWRMHPTTQQDALRTVLAEVGYADALIARETDRGLMLVDGHLRAEITPDAEVPVLILDINEAESDVILTTLDPLAAMAEANTEALRNLTESIPTDNDHIQTLLASILEANNAVLNLTPPDDFPEFDDTTRTEYRCPKCNYEWS
jgi:hypothetical protein